tara:strand:- start:11317 stop:11904 length:588 start_codon:yes stop_codon:yes gene_type:complete
MLQKKIISTFSKKHFRPGALTKFAETSLAMVDEINAMDPSLVLDLGCGTNIFKNKIQHLVGIDILNRHEDIVCPIEKLDTIFQPECADIVLALGSINFGEHDLIAEQLWQTKRVLKPGGLIYFRVNHNTTHEIYYDWDLNKLDMFTEKMKLEYEQQPQIITKVKENKIDDYPINTQLNRGQNSTRIFLIWRKPVE